MGLITILTTIRLLSTEMRLGPESLSLKKIGRLRTFVATLQMCAGQGGREFKSRQPDQTDGRHLT
jgi:hypothetical protein